MSPAHPKATGTIELVLVDSTDGLPHWGQHVRFNVTTTLPTWWVHLRCFQNGAMVGEEWKSQTETVAGSVYGLYAPDWTSGAADCTAELVPSSAKSDKPVASVDFHVSA